MISVLIPALNDHANADRCFKSVFSRCELRVELLTLHARGRRFILRQARSCGKQVSSSECSAGSRDRAREKATHDGSDVVHGNVVTTPDLMGSITLLGAVLVHNDELGGRCGCSKHNKPRHSRSARKKLRRKTELIGGSEEMCECELCTASDGIPSPVVVSFRCCVGILQ